MRMVLMQTGAVPTSVAASMSDQQVKDLLDALQVGGALGSGPPRRDDGWGRLGGPYDTVPPGCTPGNKFLHSVARFDALAHPHPLRILPPTA